MSKELMDAAKFNLVASSLCSRWEKKTLAVVRLVLVDGLSLGDAAIKKDMTPQQAAVSKSRFLKKEIQYDADRVSSYMQRVQPELKQFKNDLKTLRDKGYTSKQMVEYLNENGVIATIDDLDNFM